MSPETKFTISNAITNVQESPELQTKNVLGYIALVRSIFKFDSIATRKRILLTNKHKQTQFLLICQDPIKLKQLIQTVDLVLYADDAKDFSSFEKKLIETKFHLNERNKTEVMTINQLFQFALDTSILPSQINKINSLNSFMKQVERRLFQKLNQQIFPPRFKRYTKSEPPVSKTILTR